MPRRPPKTEAPSTTATVWFHPQRGAVVSAGPLEKVCRDCARPFVFGAAAQKQLLEEDGAFIETTAVRCTECGQRRSRIESARAAHARALEALAPGAPAASYLAAAKAALALLEETAPESSGRALDRALGHSRKAHELGARAAEALERKLLVMREARVRHLRDNTR